MEGNILLNQQVQDLNKMFVQKVCDKHEFQVVTMTTSTTIGSKTEINKSTSWLQCKHCGYSPDKYKQIL